jgi:hypothetical protein
MQNQTSQDQSVFRRLDWILCYTLFHGFDTLGSHLREEGSLEYDRGLVRLQVQTNFDTTINRQQRAKIILSFMTKIISISHRACQNCVDTKISQILTY